MRASIEVRLLAHSVEDENGCLVWRRFRDGGGYGVVRFEGGARKAHRVAYEVFVGPIPEGLVLDHLCRNRACINVDHLEPVTQRVNVGRGETGIVNRSKTHCKRGHLFSPENTRIYSGMRHCLHCKKLAKREVRARLRS